ncbi:MAG: multidrug effflux MFS transporter [Pseudomonadota bacterium]
MSNAVPAQPRRAPIWLLSLASSLSPFGMAIVVPSLGAIVAAFNADLAEAQYVISAYLFGLALAQPICGFLCDRFGRRSVMLIGFATFTIASVGCGLANSLDQLILGRFAQAAGVSVGTVASRAILRDTYDRNRMAEAMSYIAAAMGFAPIIAPVIGGLIDSAADYSAIFFASAVIGGLVFFKMLLSLPETRPTELTPPTLRAWFSSYGLLLTSRGFVGNTLAFGFVQGTFFAFMAIGAPLFESSFGIDSGGFGLLWGLMAVNYVIGATLAAKMTVRYGTTPVLRVGVIVGAIGGIAAWVSSIALPLTVVTVLVPIAISMFAAGATTPISMAGAVADYPTVAGTASGLSSAIGLVLGGSFSVLSGTIFDGRYPPIAMIICFASLATAASWWLSVSGRSSNRRTSASET